MTMARTEVRFAGHDCLKLENGSLALWVTRTVGPRILGLALPGGDNLFAELPGITLACPGRGEYSLRGGHRLWYALESPPRTYLPDDDPVVISDVEGGVRVTQPAEAGTGIQKTLTITLAESEARAVLDHRLHNRGQEAVELAPWAITQLKAGGVAILPQATAPADEYGVLPNRHVVLWPYTATNTPHLTWGDRYLFVAATMRQGKFKVGFPNPAGWLAYAVGDVLFVKEAAYQAGAVYPDRGCSSECYCDPRFLELETLGPYVTLAPGESVSHRETWTVHSGVDVGPDEALVQEWAERAL